MHKINLSASAQAFNHPEESINMNTGVRKLIHHIKHKNHLATNHDKRRVFVFRNEVKDKVQLFLVNGDLSKKEYFEY